MPSPAWFGKLEPAFAQATEQGVCDVASDHAGV
jgi:hypothetical protein